MKNLLTIILCLSLCISLCACGTTETPAEAPADEPVSETPVEETPAEPIVEESVPEEPSEEEPPVIEPEPVPDPVPDLTGTWTQTNSNSEDSWQYAIITDSTIDVFWVFDNGDTEALYWSGTFTPPASAGGYSWDSQNDHSKTDNALLASGDETKTFTYNNGEISYKVTAFDVTTTVRLAK